MAKKKTVTKTTKGTTKYTSSSSSIPNNVSGSGGAGSYGGSGSSSGGGSTSGGGSVGSSSGGGSNLSGEAGTPVGDLLRSVNTNLDPSRCFVIVASEPKYSDYVASTSVYCPMRNYEGSLGGYWQENGLSPYTDVPVRELVTGDPLTGHTQSVQGFAEVLGVVPEAIIQDTFAGPTSIVEGSHVFGYVKSIEYEYRAY